jgi:DNA-directed RNA polymerase specialized sigma24 family protein
MSEKTSISILLEQWFDHGDEIAYRRAYQTLADRMFPTPEAVKVLGRDAADEIRQDVLAFLLDRAGGKLRGAHAPVAYAKTAWRRALVSAMRKWGPRPARVAEVRQHVLGLAQRDDHAEIEVAIDAARAVVIADGLSGKGRLAVMLTTRPGRLSDEDWRKLVASLPPPPPPRPREALDRDEASRLLYPPAGPEDARRRYQRLNSFDKTFKRAVEKIRKTLEDES